IRDFHVTGVQTCALPISSLAPYSWALVSFVTIGLQAAASIMFLVLLRRLFGDRFGVLAALAVYVFAPLTVPAMSWWSAALNAVQIGRASCRERQRMVASS